MSQIKYLIKIYREEFCVDELLNNGCLYMRPVSYFTRVNVKTTVSGQRDIGEGVSLGFIRVHQDNAIYCMYAVYDDQIDGNFILINKKAIYDFCGIPMNGFLAIFPYKRFIESLNNGFFDGYKLTHGLVNYSILSIEEDCNNLCNLNDKNHIFNKHPSFQHQQEYRIVSDLRLTKTYYKIEDCPNYKAIVPNTIIFGMKFSTSALENYNLEYYSLFVNTLY
ncbi:MAG: hypothetical protein ACRCZJ_07715 [Erysipelotrichaceae bacterium]